jgi:hypothetical protein
MRDAGKITVQRAIVHMIDLAKDAITRSDFELDLMANAGVRDYFGSQVTKALGDHDTVSALFVKSDKQSEAAAACFGLLQDNPSFIDLSQKLASLLMAAMRTHSSIAPGDLAVCLYTAEKYPSKTFLALFKLDPGRALLQKIDPRGGGKQAVTLDALNDVLPTEQEQLQKAALVPPAEMKEAFELLLLDRQVPGVAAFFAKTFLNTTPARDAPTQTETFHQVVGDAAKQLMKNPPKGIAPISIQEQTAILDLRDRDMSRKKVSISGYVARVRDNVKDPAAAAHVGERLKKALPDPTIEIDKPVAERLLYKKRFKGEHGVRFEVEFDYKDVVVKEIKPIVTVDGKKVTRVTLHVTDFEWLN